MSMVLTIIHIAIIALVAQLEVEGKDFYIRTDSDVGECKYSGYIPGGKQINISPIKSTTASLETNILANIAGFGGNAGTDAIQFPKISSTIENIAPNLGPALALFTVVLSAALNSELLTTTQEGMEDITLTGLFKLIEDVNDKFTDMENYVDQETLNVIKGRINTEYIHMFTLYSNCITEVSLQRAVECQEDANQYIRSGLPKFMLFTDELKKFTMSSPPTADQIKKMELTFLPFREYATLSLMQLQVLKDTYRDNQNSLKNGPTIYRELLGKLSSDAQKRIDYAQNMFKWIDLTYDEFAKNRCKDTKTSWSRCTNEGGWGSYTVCFGYTKCQFDMTISSKKYCTTRCTVRADGQKIYTKKTYPDSFSNQDTGKKFTAEEIDLKASAYLSQKSKDVKNYYESQVLSSIPVWQEIKNKADAELMALNDETNINYNFEGRQFKRTHTFNPIQRKYMPVGDFEFFEENDEKNSDLENRKLNYRYEENYRRSEYPILKDAEYGEFNDRFENDLSLREKKIKDGRFSPRFKERYQRAFDTMRYFDDLNRARRF